MIGNLVRFRHKKIKNNSKIYKNPAMILTWVGLWLGAVIALDGRLILLFDLSTNLMVKFLIGFVFLWIHIIWFYGAYHITTVLFSIIIIALERKNKYGQKANISFSVNEDSRIAILYTTMNDFCKEAAESCVNQVYPCFHMYLLDDSSMPEEQSKVNCFHTYYPEKTTIIRRKEKNWGKAGNMNNALNIIASKYRYFCIADADEILPSNFLTECVKELDYDPQLAFVQANHEL